MSLKRKEIISVISLPILLVGIFLFVGARSDEVNQLKKGGVKNYEIYDLVKKTTLRVSGNHRYGSGVIIASDEKNKIHRYLVITSRHNIDRSPSDPNQQFYVFTPDGLVYPAILLENESKKIFQTKDLTLIYFQSYQPNSYEVAAKPKKWDTKDQPDKNINVAGFPCTGEYCLSIDPLTVTPCNGIILEKPLVQGYQLGCDRDFMEGTSGGGVFNSNRELIAIAGKRFSNDNNSIEQYNYADNSKKVSPEDIKKFQSLSWAIPLDKDTYAAIEKVLATINISNNYSNFVALQSQVNKKYANQIKSITEHSKEEITNQRILSVIMILIFVSLLWQSIQINKLTKVSLIQKNNNIESGNEDRDMARQSDNSRRSKNSTLSPEENQNYREDKFQ